MTHRETRHATQRHRGGLRNERGSISIWMAASSFIMIVLVGLAVDLGGKVHTQQQARNVAAQAARTGAQEVQCVTMSVSVDTGGFQAPIGTTAQVTATVTCTVNLSDLAIPGLPGSRTITETVSSPIDAYRERR